MPHVASPSTKVHAHSHGRAGAARPLSAQDRGTPSLFDNLVDNSSAGPAGQPGQGATSTAAQQPPHPRSVDKTAKADAGQGQATAQPSNQPPAEDAGAAADATEPADQQAATAVAAAAALDGDGNKPDAPKETGKADAGPDAAADPTAPAPVDPSLLADASAAVTPVTPATPQPVQQPSAGAVDTTIPGPQAAPAQPAFVAAVATKKFDAVDGKGEPESSKPAAADAKAAASAPAPAPPTAADQPAAPQPQPAANPAVAAGAKPAATATDKPVAKPDAQTHRDRIDAAAAAKLDAVAPTAADPGAASQASATSAAAGTATQATAASTGSTPPQAAQNLVQPAAVPVAGLAVVIAGRAHAGTNNFEIRLDPPELGRIQVKLTMDRQGQVTSHLIADRPDTLDLLRRDAAGLERALQDAGLKTAGDGLQFSLRDQSFAGQQQSGGGRNASHVVAVDDIVVAAEPAAGSYTRYAGRIGGVDIRV